MCVFSLSFSWGQIIVEYSTSFTFPWKEENTAFMPVESRIVFSLVI